MKIGLAQMNSRNDKEQNLTAAEGLIDRLAEQEVRLAMLPENFNFMGAEEEKPAYAENLSGSPSLDRLRRKAVEHGMYIHCGSLLESAGGSVYNTAVVLDPAGEIAARYRKIHLFDVEVPGGRRYLESKTISAGDEIVTVTIDQVTCGLATCYDLRFPELFRELSSRGAQVMLLPAAFTLRTGRDHWELLLRARAVENLCYVAAAGQYGAAPPNHDSYGRSMVIDPWGVVNAQTGDGVGTVTAEIDVDRLQAIRRSFPSLDHRRSDLFA